MRTKQENMKISKESRIRTIKPAMAGIFGVLGFVGLSLSNINAFAEVFEAEQGLSFTLNSSVAVSITGGTGSGSDGLTIDDLVPGNSKDSNIITVTASSNSASGYTLSSSVGSSTYTSTELRRNGTETANKFASLTANKASLSNFDPGYWGYSYSTNGGTSWISGDIVGGTSAGYNGLPLYTTTTPIKLINSSSASSSSIQFKIGAKATSSQVSGAYTNIINFIGVGKVITTTYTINYNTNGGSTISSQSGTTDNGAVQIPATNVPTKQDNIFKGWCTIDNSSDPTTCTGTNAEIIQPGSFLPLNTSSASITKPLYAVWKSTKTFMQDATLADCGQIMYDKRDENDYTTALINGECYMTQNLRFTGTSLSTITSNVSSDRTISYGDLTSGNTYTEARIHNSGDTTTGVWYNFCAAGAMETNACYMRQYTESYDICPKNWHLPTNSQISGITHYQDAFSPVAGGSYTNGSLGDTGDGYWWSATAYDASRQYYLSYNGSSLNTKTDGFKPVGYYVRCVRSS